MSTPSTRLGFPIPEGRDNHNLENFQNLIKDIDAKVAKKTDLDAHVANKVNPHAVTTEQIGTYTKAVIDSKDLAVKTEMNNKIVALEQDLQATDVTHSQQEFIKSLPTGSKNGPIKGFEYKGQTLINSIRNGNFSSGTTGWNPSSGNISISASAQNNEMVLTLKGTGSAYSGVYSTIRGARVGDIFYFSIDVLPKYAGSILVGFDDARKEIQIGVPNTYNKVSALNVFKNSTAVTFYLNMGVQYVLNDTAKFKNVVALNLTQIFGAGNEPTKEQMDEILDGYVDSIQNAKLDVKTTGRNLFDLNEFFDVQASNGVTVSKRNNGFNVSSNTPGMYRIASAYKRLLPNTAYYILAKSERLLGTFGGNIAITDRSGTNISTVISEYPVPIVKFTVPSDGIVAIYFYATVGVSETGSVNYTDIHLEQASASIPPYEPHKSSTLTSDIELRSLPNGVRDRIFEDNGQLWLERNVGYISPVWNISWANTNKNATNVIVHASADSVPNLKKNLTWSSTVGVFPENTSILANTAGNLLHLTIKNADAGWPNDTYPSPTNTKVNEYLNSIKATFLYQLAQPELINLTEQGLISGELFSYPGGYAVDNSSIRGLLSFSAPTDTGAQLTSLISSAERQAKQIESKADAVQEDWLKPTLLNGWIEYYLGRGIRYYKDSMGIVRIQGLIRAGVITKDTLLFTLPMGYRPSVTVYTPVISTDDSLASISVNLNGDVMIYISPKSNTFLSVDGISFKAEG